MADSAACERTLEALKIPPIPYPPSLSLARVPTPLEPMNRLTNYLGLPPLWVKRDDLTGLELSGNKVRKLEFLLARAQAEKADCLVTCGAIQSNHCRATAAVGAKLGYPVRLILRGDQPKDAPDGNLLLDHLFGAEVILVPPREFDADKEAIIARAVEELRRQGRKPFYFPVGASTPLGVWAYVRCLEELRRQTIEQGIELRHVVVGCGSGGTTAGLILGRALLGWKELSVWSVAVWLTETYWQNELRKLLTETCREFALDLAPEQLPIQVTDAYTGPGYAIPYPEVIETIRLVARTEGLLLDPVYTGKAMTGLLDMARRGVIGCDEATVFIHTGGTFGLFPARSEFA